METPYDRDRSRERSRSRSRSRESNLREASDPEQQTRRKPARSLKQINAVKEDRRLVPSTLSMLMSCHGGIVSPNQIGGPISDLRLFLLPVPTDVKISKLNVSPFGDFTCSVASYRKESESISITKKLLSGIDTYCTEKNLSTYKTVFDKSSPNLTTIDGKSIPHIRCSEGFYVTQTDADYYVQKIYSPDSTTQWLSYFWISHTKTDECLNIFYCTELELITFLKIPHTDSHNIKNIQTIITRRNTGATPLITTNEIYFIIEMAKMYLSTNAVNIVDESCNYIPCGVIGDNGDDIGVRCKYGTAQIDEIMSKFLPNTKYGGKTKRKRKQKICI